ncbi:ribonuclease VapC [Jatrophihabitans endophyticus]|uniref:Ribonuclease VapC n=1 Tax=Jatrophihabitans endophyticus TaxID=1206085 RepID=A0A1M5ER26_9ACTN|nr:type II toxin-antitoxin system VapC family toxin [Jatrophihabitans endophyticus]SHF81763.1 ribonuclease VapC [Jatrophihabitans endophyticus]
MIVDPSALVAVLTSEPDASELLVALRTQTSTLSAAGYLEAAIVIDSRRDPVLSAQLDELLQRTKTGVVTVTPSQARVARQAYREFGKGSGHRAQLNFGDCFSYALAVETGERLLYKGDDFVHTGIRSALAGP